ncbi:MAG: hypothetical protein IPQ04_04525 [Saprospiraceae bacterium]|nr:hypothetical protein [Saprospiraceae bacterium]
MRVHTGVTVVDGLGCATSMVTQVYNQNGPNASTTVSASTCNQTNGSITVVVVGGEMPYSFDFGGGSQSNNQTNVGSGNYLITVTDNQGCTTTVGAIVTNVGGPSATAISDSTSCGGINGSITVARPAHTAIQLQRSARTKSNQQCVPRIWAMATIL